MAELFTLDANSEWVDTTMGGLGDKAEEWRNLALTEKVSFNVAVIFLDSFPFLRICAPTWQRWNIVVTTSVYSKVHTIIHHLHVWLFHRRF